MIQCGRHLRSIGDRAGSLEDASGKIVDYLYENFTLEPDPETRLASVLARLFVTRLYSELNEAQKTAARTRLNDNLPPEDFNNLTLMASRGEEMHWNSPDESANHQAIPLLNAEEVNKLPMVASLLEQLGLETREVIKTKREIMLDPDRHQSYGVFLVPKALGSPVIPAQEDFVKPYGIRSVVGFGGRLIPGHLFSVILFTRCGISRDRADLFRTLALNTRVSLLRLAQLQSLKR